MALPLALLVRVVLEGELWDDVKEEVGGGMEDVCRVCLVVVFVCVWSGVWNGVESGLGGVGRGGGWGEGE